MKLSTITKLLILAWSAILAIFISSQYAIAVNRIEYGPRGTHWEGVKGQPVAGQALRLISCTANHVESSDDIPPKYRLCFYLPKGFNPDITVRELYDRTHYWLDRIHPKERWNVNSANEYHWSTATVIRQLDLLEVGKIKLPDLGCLVLLESPQHKESLVVSPAILSARSKHITTTDYSFVFIPSHAAMVRARVSERDPRRTRVLAELDVEPQLPFSVTIPHNVLRDGWNQLAVTGFYKKTNNPISETIKFYHWKTNRDEQ